MARKPAAKPAQKSKATADTTSVLEWIAGGIGLLLLLLVVGVIGREALFGDRSPPAVLVEQVGAQAVPGGYLVRIKVRNDGGRSAAQVVVEGELTRQGAEPETGEATFDYVPPGSSREGGLFFTADPAAGELALRAKGYVEP
ncbi:TIGR02588 family protein [Caulobacter sp. SLTY]|uniref:TIGR02588 family protein n=1 Tax=Caulobacter sp. SLTY TaxID=2683262 RepID=UPI001411B782|nr:TIGR02588 family protein [Caulobacter sp. SLTY]NBB14338.1 TIGR02588 family protein [Caulobacter sp. SLTY]